MKTANFLVGQRAWLVSTDHNKETIREVNIIGCSDTDHVGAYAGMENKPPFIYEARCREKEITKTHIWEDSLKKTWGEACIALDLYNEAERVRVAGIVDEIRKKGASNGNAWEPKKGEEDEA